MRARTASLPLFALLLSACASVLGIDEVEYDASIDGAGGSSSGAAGEGEGGEAGEGQGGSDAGAGGSDAGVGGSDAGAGAGGDAGAGGSEAGSGGSDAGAGGGGAGQGGGGSGGQTDSACSDESKALFVSATGNDGDPGTKSKPKKTISKALADAGEKREVCVCKGSYTEATGILLNKAISIRGGYDCTTWARLPGVNKPGLNNMTTVTTSEASKESEGASLYVTGSVVDSTVVIEGLTIQGGNTTGVGPEIYGGSALRISNGASPIVQYVSAQAGNGIAGPGAGGRLSSGLLVTTGASPVVKSSKFSGGSGISAGFGVQLDLSGNSVTLDGNLLLGGDGTTPCEFTEGSTITLPWASGGVLAKGNGTLILQNNWIYGGSGHRSASCDYSVAGAAIQESGGKLNVTLKKNVIDAGHTDAAGLMTGVWAASAGSFLLESNRIYGGSLDVDNANIETAGVWFKEGSKPELQIINNMIHGGNGTARKSKSVTALALLDGKGPVLFNTLFSGGISQSAEKSHTTTAVHLGKSTKLDELVLERNAFHTPVTSAGEARAIFTEQCPSAIQGANGNVFATGATILAFSSEVPASCYEGKTLPLKDTTSAAQVISAACSGSDPKVASCKANEWGLMASVCQQNGPNCIIFPNCSASGTATNCQAGLFSNWNSSDTGREILVGNPPTSSSTLLINPSSLGWRLAKGLPCPLYQAVSSPTPGTPVVSEDLFGTARANMPSPGAEQVDPTGCQGGPPS